MNFPRRNLTNIIFIQVISAIASCGFIYMQMHLISGLEQEMVNNRMAVLTAVVLVLSIFLELFEAYTRGRSYTEFSAEIKGKIADSFLKKTMKKHGEKTDEEHISFFYNEVDTVLNQYFYLGLYGIKLLLQFCASFLTLFIISWQCGLAVTAAAVAFGLVIRALSGKLAEIQKQLQEKKAAFVDTLVELHEGYEEIHLNQMESLAKENFAQANRSVEKKQCDYRMAQLGMETLGIGQNMLIYILILIVGGWLACMGRTGLGVFISAASLSVQALNQWSMLSRIHVARKGVEQIKKELDVYLEEVLFDMSLMQNTSDVLVEVHNLHFCYDAEIPLLEDVNLMIRRGDKILITGESGKGKSTLLELLVGHKECQNGKICRFTDRIAYVPQEPFLFHGTLRENIVFDQKDIDDDILGVLLKKLELDLSLDFLIEEKGANLSGGQKVRVALARALFAEPELLVTDELTANLDSSTGQKIENKLLEEDSKMAWCAVSHRTYFPAQYDMHVEIGNKEVAS